GVGAGPVQHALDVVGVLREVLELPPQGGVVRVGQRERRAQVIEQVLGARRRDRVELDARGRAACRHRVERRRDDRGRVADGGAREGRDQLVRGRGAVGRRTCHEALTAGEQGGGRHRRRRPGRTGPVRTHYGTPADRWMAFFVFLRRPAGVVRVHRRNRTYRLTSGKRRRSQNGKTKRIGGFSLSPFA